MYTNEPEVRQTFLSLTLHVIVMSATATDDSLSRCPSDVKPQHSPVLRRGRRRSLPTGARSACLFTPEARHQLVVNRPTHLLGCSTPSRYVPRAPTDHASFAGFSSLTAEVNGLPGYREQFPVDDGGRPGASRDGRRGRRDALVHQYTY